jgi:hypothetical protein
MTLDPLASRSMMLPSIVVPVIGVTPKTLFPVGPGVAASSVSAPFPTM